MTRGLALRCVTCGRLTATWAQMDRHLVEEHDGHDPVANVLDTDTPDKADHT